MANHHNGYKPSHGLGIRWLDSNAVDVTTSQVCLRHLQLQHLKGSTSAPLFYLFPQAHRGKERAAVFVCAIQAQ